MTNEDAVLQIATAMADAEDAADTVRNSFRDTKDAFAQLSSNPGVSVLESLAFATELDALATKFQADLYAAHSRLVVRATELGFEELMPPMRSGTGR